MENPLGVLAKQDGQLAVVLFLKVLYLFNHQIFPYSGPKYEEVFSAKDLILCRGKAQTVLLPYDFF